MQNKSIKVLTSDYKYLNYDECYAKLILEHCFPNEFHNLRLSDRPDIIDDEHGVGIEVTRGLGKKDGELKHNWLKALYCDGIKKERAIERMSQLRCSFTGPVQEWPSETITYSKEDKSIQLLLESVKKKVVKLNKGLYGNEERIRLFILTECALEYYKKQDLIGWLVDENKGRLTYEKIYISSQGSSLYVLTENKLLDEYSFKDSQVKLACKALDMANGKRIGGNTNG